MRKLRLGKTLCMLGITAMAMAFSGVTGLGNKLGLSITAEAVTDYENSWKNYFEFIIPEGAKLDNGTQVNGVGKYRWAINSDKEIRFFKVYNNSKEIDIPAVLQYVKEHKTSLYNGDNTSNDFSGYIDDNSVITSIGYDCFQDDKTLQKVILPRTVKRIENHAFNSVKTEMKTLTDVVWEDTTDEVNNPIQLEQIDHDAFYFCTQVKSFELGDNIKVIDYNAFDKSGITKITISKSVTSLGKEAFADCADLELVDFEIGSGAILGTDCFKGHSKELVFYCEPSPENSETGSDGLAYPWDYAQGNEIIYQRHTDSIKITKKSDNLKYDCLCSDDVFKNNWMDGIEFEVKYTKDNETTTVKAESDQYDMIKNCIVSGFDSKEVGPKTITVKYGGKDINTPSSATYTVTVFYNLNNSNNITASLADDNIVFTGTENKPKVTVKNVTKDDVEVSLKERESDASDTATPDCWLTYENNVNAGTAKVTIMGNESAGHYYTGTKVFTFTIDKADIADIDVEFKDGPFVYNGKAQTPEVTLKLGEYELKSTDYKAITPDDYNNNINASTEEAGATLTITASENEGSNFKGVGTFKFDIEPESLEGTDIVVGDIAEQTYNGTEILPEVNVKYKVDGTNELILEKNKDYTVEGENNINAGKDTTDGDTTAPTIIIKGMGNYTGAITKTFTINPETLTEEMVETIEDVEYTGKPVDVEPIVKIGDVVIDRQYYDVDFGNEDERPVFGEAEVTITGKDNLTGEVTVSYQIANADLKDAEITAIPAQFATGNEIKPEITVTLNGNTVDNDECEIIYADNIEIGKATVTVKAKTESDDAEGTTDTYHYKGQVTAEFDIIGLSLDAGGSGKDDVRFDIALDKTSYTYSGAENVPSVSVKRIDTDSNGESTETTLSADTDYSVEMEKGVHAGSYKVTVSGKGIYVGSRTLTYAVEQKDLSNAKLDPIPEQAYTGKSIMPKVTVTLDGAKLVENDDYKVTYSGNVDAGTAVVTVEGVGDYMGKVTGNFIITKPAEPVEPEKPATEATTEVVTQAPTTEATTEALTTQAVEIPSVSKVKSFKATARSKGLTLTWKKVSKAEGYELSYATKKNYKNAKVVNVKASKKTYVFKKLKAKTKYYVRIRAYKTYIDASGTTQKVYGKWASLSKKTKR